MYCDMAPSKDQRANFAIQAAYYQQDMSHVTCWEFLHLTQANENKIIGYVL